VRRRRIGILVGTALLVLTLDIVTKVTVVATLSDRSPIRLLGGFLTCWCRATRARRSASAPR
jgi:hypothetical protein